jgi:hypothetical protein
MLGIRQDVLSRLGKAHVKKCLAEVDTSCCSFWSLSPWANIAQDSVILALYKGTTRDSLDTIRRKLESEHHFSKMSLAHNVREARKALGQWASGVITPDVTTRQLCKISPVAKLLAVGCRTPGCVFIDSVDFKRNRSGNLGPKQDPDWSYKERAPAQRYLVISDSNTRVLWIAGPFSPKVHQSSATPPTPSTHVKVVDGHLLLSSKESVERAFRGLAIVGDQHFEMAGPAFQKCEIVTPVGAQKGKLVECPSLRHPTRMKRQLSESELERNRAVHAIRGRAEQPFASVKLLFANLDKKFAGQRDEQKWVVKTALTFHNLRLHA